MIEFRAGDRVRVHAGTLRGYAGTVLRLVEIDEVALVRVQLDHDNEPHDIRASLLMRDVPQERPV